jgi:hypothetical protein
MCRKDRLSKPTGSGTADIRGIRFYSEIRVALIHTPGPEIKDTKYEIRDSQAGDPGSGDALLPAKRRWYMLCQ